MATIGSLIASHGVIGTPRLYQAGNTLLWGRHWSVPHMLSLIFTDDVTNGPLFREILGQSVSYVAQSPDLLASAFDVLSRNTGRSRDQQHASLSTWYPFCMDDRHKGRGTNMYAAMVCKMSVLERVLTTLCDRQAQFFTEEAALRATRQERNRTEPRADFVPDNVSVYEYNPSVLDMHIHWLMHWYDAHVPLTCALEDVGDVLYDDDPLWQTLLNVLAPDLRLVFWEGSVPSLDSYIADTLFVSDDEHVAACKKSFPLAYLAHRMLPQRTQLSAIQHEVRQAGQSPDIHGDVASIVLASTLGVYRHCRRRPLGRSRRNLIRAFLYDPPDDVLHGMRQYHEQRSLVYDHVQRRTEAVQIVVGEDQLEYVWPRTGVTNDVALLLDAIGSCMCKLRGPSARAQLINVVIREWTCVQFTYHTQVYSLLREHFEWGEWSQTVFDAGDAWRSSDSNLSALNGWSAKLSTQHTLPLSTVPSFFQTFVREAYLYCEGQGVFERPVSWMWDERFAWILECVFHDAPMSPDWARVHVSDTVPPTDASSLEETDAIPMRLFRVSSEVVQLVEAHHQLYLASRSVDLVKRAVKTLVADYTVEELLSVLAVMRYVERQRTCFVQPLPGPWARAQEAAVRAHVQLHGDDVVDAQTMSVLLCTKCMSVSRAFYGTRARYQVTVPVLVDETLDDYAARSYESVLEDSFVDDMSPAELWNQWKDEPTLYPDRPYVTQYVREHGAEAVSPALNETRGHDNHTRGLYALEEPNVTSAFTLFVRRGMDALSTHHGEPILTGQGSEDKMERAQRYVCATHKPKHYRRKMNTQADDSEDDNDVDVSRTKSAKSGRVTKHKAGAKSAQVQMSEARERRNARLAYETELCRQRGMVEVGLVGRVLHLSAHTAVTWCTKCVQLFNIYSGEWRHDAVICAKCAAGQEVMIATANLERCLHCGTKTRSSVSVVVIENSVFANKVVCERCWQRDPWISSQLYVPNVRDVYEHYASIDTRGPAQHGRMLRMIHTTLKQHWRKTCLEEDTVLLETEERVAAAGEENVRKQHNVIGNAMRSTKYRAAVLDPKSG